MSSDEPPELERRYQAEIVAESSAWAAVERIAAELHDATRIIAHQGGDTDYDGVISVLWRRLLQLDDLPVDPWSTALLAQGAEYVARGNQPPRRRKLDAKLTLAVFRRDDFRCVACGTSDDLSVDHIHPLALGGTDEPENLQTLCGPCNSRKGARLS